MKIQFMAGSAALLLLTIPAGAVDAQIQTKTGTISASVSGHLQTQFNSTSVNGVESTEFLLRRMRIALEVTVNDLISAKLQPDFGSFDADLADAWMRLSFTPQFRVTMGQFKRPFDVMELESSTRILVIERDGRIRGVNNCTGVGGVCSYARLLTALEYSARDIGVMVDGTTSNDQFTYMVSLTNGTGDNVDDENGSKSLGARFSVNAAENLAIAGSFAAHDYVGIPDDDYAIAFGGDVKYGDRAEGLQVQGGIALGDNWEVLGAGGDPGSFFTLQGIVSYRAPVQGNRSFTHVEPVARLSWADPDTDIDDNSGILFTPGVILHLPGSSRFMANLDFWSPSQGDTEIGLKLQTDLVF